ncbi:TRM11 family SAM-dependent methyltransferase [Cohnella nanjingensis]|uniref:TRM11 family SAM-dependent methyltransferase n=1 Tax=Cohnella nanjingensis TaxID=1387779 RepID=UPI001C87D374|nr:RNA methyltransferase [Cohnella nanjingensis]
MYVYTYACHEDERELCELEWRTLFDLRGDAPKDQYVCSPISIDPRRSPFMKRRLEIRWEGSSLEELEREADAMSPDERSFKLIYVDTAVKLRYEDRLALERRVGARLRGRVDMRRPERLLGITQLEDRWVFGEVVESEAVWLRHNRKPRSYSTALSTRVARAIANIAVPAPEGVRAIDPCCGIGTVLIEARSMGIDIVGNDVNPLAVRGARMNLAHFGYPATVTLGDVRALSGSYDAAVLDMPYNRCSVAPPEEQLEMIASLRRLAERAVILTTEPIEPLIVHAGFAIQESCAIPKGSFVRHVHVCR